MMDTIRCKIPDDTQLDQVTGEAPYDPRQRIQRTGYNPPDEDMPSSNGVCLTIIGDRHISSKEFKIA